MKTPASAFYRNPVKFRMPTAENLVPIRLDIEIDGQRYKDVFTGTLQILIPKWSSLLSGLSKDFKLPPAAVTQIAQPIKSQLTEFHSYEGQDMYAGEKIVPIKLDLCVNHTPVKDQFLWVRLN